MPPLRAKRGNLNGWNDPDGRFCLGHRITRIKLSYEKASRAGTPLECAEEIKHVVSSRTTGLLMGYFKEGGTTV